MGYEQIWGNPLFDMKVGDSLDIGYNFDHPDYTTQSDIWKTCRDATKGQDSIKAEQTRYLPQMNGQTEAEYANYLQRALYYNATGRTVRSYNGMIFRKDPLLKMFNKDGEEATDFNKDSYTKSITNKGKSLNSLLQDVVDEIIQVNRVGILVDYPEEADFGSVSQMSKLDKEQLGWKPVLTQYKAESIVNWQYIYVGTTPIPVMYVVKEEVWAYNGGIFPEKADIYRVMALEPYAEFEDGPLKVRYKQITFKETETQVKGEPSKSVWGVDSVVYPKKNGKDLNFIPFYLITDKGVDFENLDNPMIYDLAVLNISHYMNSADLENENHMVSAKTLYFGGWDTKVYGQPRIGGALGGPQECVPKEIEFSNKSGLADEMERKESRMAVLGSEAISKQGRYVASAATAKISSKAEASILTTLTMSVSTAFSEILTFVLDWDDQPDLEARVTLNYDFYDENISAQELIQFMKAWQSGGLSDTAYFNLLQKKETYPEDWDQDKEFKAIQDRMSVIYDLPEERFLELTSRLDKLAEYTKQMESGAITNLVAEGMSDDLGGMDGAETIKKFEEGSLEEPVEEETQVETPPVVENEQ